MSHRLRLLPLRRSQADALAAALGDWRTCEIPDDIKIKFTLDSKGRQDDKTLREIATHIGDAAALRLCQKLGGDYLYIPQTLRSDHPLIAAIGQAAADKMSKIYTWNRLDVPTAYYHLRRIQRASLIASIRANQITMSGAAKLLGIPVRRMREYTNATREGFKVAPLLPITPSPQLDLFADTPPKDDGNTK
jgi:hypothetical protein